MLPAEEEANCRLDKNYKRAIDIYFILPKDKRTHELDYIELLTPLPVMQRRFSEEHDKSNKLRSLIASKSKLQNVSEFNQSMFSRSVFGNEELSSSRLLPHHPPLMDSSHSLIPPVTMTSTMLGPPATETRESPRRERSEKADMTQSPPKTKSVKSPSRNTSNLAISIPRSPPKNGGSLSLSRMTERRKGNRQRSRTHGDLSAKISWADVVAGRSKLHNKLYIRPIYDPKTAYIDTVTQWSTLVQQEHTTPKALNEGLQAFTALTLERLTDNDCVVSNSLDDEAGTGLRDGLRRNFSVTSEDDYYVGPDDADDSWNINNGSVRPRALSQADLGESRSQLKHWTLKELYRSVLDSDTIESWSFRVPSPPKKQMSRNSSKIDLNAAVGTSDLLRVNSINGFDNQLQNHSFEDEELSTLLFECNGCLDMFKSSDLAFTCHHMGCNGNFCIDCLYRSVVVTVSSAAYAVPLVRCPGRCHGR